MGCCGNKTNSKEEKLRELKIQLATQIQINDIKENNLKRSLTKIKMEIEQLEYDIKENNTGLSEIEQKNKKKKIAELKNDQIRKERELKHSTILNETMKNNLTMMEMKIEEYHNAKSIEESNAILKQIYSMDFRSIYKKNNENLNKIKLQDEKNMKELEDANKQFLEDNEHPVQSPEEILNNLIYSKNVPAPSPV